MWGGGVHCIDAAALYDSRLILIGRCIFAYNIRLYVCVSVEEKEEKLK